jgi:NAD(P)H-flavin reductase
VAVTIGPPVMYRFVLMELLGKGIADGNIWMSLERRMKCGVGKCGHCQINHLYTCQSGPVFSYAEIKHLEEAL